MAACVIPDADDVTSATVLWTPSAMCGRHVRRADRYRTTQQPAEVEERMHAALADFLRPRGAADSDFDDHAADVAAFEDEEERDAMEEFERDCAAPPRAASSNDEDADAALDSPEDDDLLPPWLLAFFSDYDAPDRAEIALYLWASGICDGFRFLAVDRRQRAAVVAVTLLGGPPAAPPASPFHEPALVMHAEPGMLHAYRD